MGGLRSFDLCCADVSRIPFLSWSGASVYIGVHFLARIRNLLRCSRAVQRNLVEPDLRRALNGLLELDCLFLSRLGIMTTPNKITGPNAGGPRQLPIRTRWADRVAQFRRSP